FAFGGDDYGGTFEAEVFAHHAGELVAVDPVDGMVDHNGVVVLFREGVDGIDGHAYAVSHAAPGRDETGDCFARSVIAVDNEKALAAQRTFVSVSFRDAGKVEGCLVRRRMVAEEDRNTDLKAGSNPWGALYVNGTSG